MSLQENEVENQEPEINNEINFDKNKQRSNNKDLDLVFSTRNRKTEKKRKSIRSSPVYADIDDYVYKYSKRRSSSNSKKKMKTWKKVVISLISIILALLIFLVSIFFIGRFKLLEENKNVKIEIPTEVATEDDGYIIGRDGHKYKYNENITTILCMGVDKKELNDAGIHGKGGSSDVLLMVTVDTSTGKTNLINISRDTMAEIDVYSGEGKYSKSEKTQICLAYAYGDGKHTSCENQVKAVSRLFYNIPISSYASLDLDGIKVINDYVGGVSVYSPETIGPFTAGQYYTLYGNDAETFVRKRDVVNANGNQLRMERQKIYLESFIGKVVEKTKKDIQTPVALFETATPYICTNLDASKITYLGLNALRGQYNEFKVQSLDGKIKQGDVYVEYHLNEDKFFDMFLDVFCVRVD